mgnify:CR=1 FL=1
MIGYATISLRNFAVDVETSIDGEPFAPVKYVVRDMVSDGEFSKTEEHQIGQKFQDLKYIG